VSKANSDRAKLNIIARTRKRAIKGLAPVRLEMTEVTIAPIDRQNLETSELVLSFHLSMARRVVAVFSLKRLTLAFCDTYRLERNGLIFARSHLDHQLKSVRA